MIECKKENERKIGKQLVVVKIVQSESEGYQVVSRFTVDDIAKWMDISYQEADRFVELILMLDMRKLRTDAALSYTMHMSIDERCFYDSVFHELGYWLKIIYPHKMESFYSIFAKYVEENLVYTNDNLDKGKISTSKIIDSAKYYYQTYIDRIIDVLEEGYDWDIVKAIINDEDEEHFLAVQKVINKELEIRKQ